MGFDIIGKLQKRSKKYLEKKAEYYKKNKPEIFKEADESGKALIASVMVAKANGMLYAQLVGAFKQLLQNDTKSVKFIYNGKEEVCDIEQELKDYEELIKNEYIKL